MAAPPTPKIVNNGLKTPSLLNAVESSIIKRMMTFMPFRKIMKVKALEYPCHNRNPNPKKINKTTHKSEKALLKIEGW